MAVNPNMTEVQPVSLNKLVIEKITTADEGTLMAWIKASASMISLGFTIYKFLKDAGRTAENQARFHVPKIFGNNVNRFWPSYPDVRDPAS